MNSRLYYRISIIMMITLIANSCNKSNRPDSIPIINLDEATDITVDSIMDKLEVIPLELGNNHYPSGFNSMWRTNDKIILIDSRNVVFVYTSDGKYLSDSTNKIGNGAGEYSIATAISYNKHSDCIEVATPTQLLFYDFKFNLIKASLLPTRRPGNGTDGVFFGFIHDISNHEHLLIPESVMEDSRKIMVYDSESGTVIKNFEYDDYILADMTMQTNCFHDMPSGEIAFFPPGITNYSFLFNPGTQTLNKQHYLDYGEKGINKSDLGNHYSNLEKLRLEVISSEKTIPLKTMLCGDNLVIVLKRGDTLKDFITFIWNVEIGKGYVLNAYFNEKISFPIIDYSDDSGLYSIVDSENIGSLTSVISPSKVTIADSPISEGSIVLILSLIHI